MRKILAAAITFPVFATMSLLGMGSASASTQYYEVCSLTSDYCLWTAGFNNNVEAKTPNEGDLTSFSRVNPTEWSGHTVYEYKQKGLNTCLSYSTSGGAYGGSGVLMETCGAGNPDELWWSSPTGAMVSDYGTHYLSGEACMYDWEGGGTYYMDVTYCDGDSSQGWAPTDG